MMQESGSKCIKRVHPSWDWTSIKDAIPVIMLHMIVICRASKFFTKCEEFPFNVWYSQLSSTCYDNETVV